MAYIRALVPSDEPALEAFLHAQLETSIHLLSALRATGLADPGKMRESVFAALFERERIAGVVAQLSDNTMHLRSSKQLGELCLAALAHSKRPWRAIRGPQYQVDALVQFLGLHESDFEATRLERLFALDLEHLIEPPILASGEVRGRPIQFQELATIQRWQDEETSDCESLAASGAFMSDAEPLMRARRFWVLKHKGELVACMAFGLMLAEAAQVRGVYAPPGLPMREYGSSVLAAALLDARTEGVQTAVVWLSEDSTRWHASYEALGFRHIADECTLVLKKSVLP